MYREFNVGRGHRLGWKDTYSKITHMVANGEMIQSFELWVLDNDRLWGKKNSAPINFADTSSNEFIMHENYWVCADLSIESCEMKYNRLLRKSEYNIVARIIRFILMGLLIILENMLMAASLTKNNIIVYTNGMNMYSYYAIVLILLWPFILSVQ